MPRGIYIRTEEYLKKLSLAHFGKPCLWNRKKWSEERKRKHSERLKIAMNDVLVKPNLAHFGSDNSAYIDGRTEKFKKWKEGVYSSCNYKCIKCGSTNKLHAHHILNKKQFPELQFKIENGITFCSGDHSRYHRIYGNDGTFESIVKFLEITT